MLQNTITQARKMRDDEGGFTLIELLIVITVLGILAVIVVFGVATFRQDATDTAKATSCKTVSVAAEAYNAKNGSYPGTVAALVSGGYLKAPAPAGIGPAIDATTGVAAGC